MTTDGQLNQPLSTPRPDTDTRQYTIEQAECTSSRSHGTAWIDVFRSRQWVLCPRTPDHPAEGARRGSTGQFAVGVVCGVGPSLDAPPHHALGAVRPIIDGVRMAAAWGACSDGLKSIAGHLVLRDHRRMSTDEGGKLRRVVQTCSAYPSQWDAWTADGQYLYLRYRHGEGCVEWHPGPEDDADTCGVLERGPLRAPDRMGRRQRQRRHQP